jgi:hypothetical protein
MNNHEHYSGPVSIGKLPSVTLDKEGNMVKDRVRNPLKNWVVLTDPLNFQKVLHKHRQTNTLFLSLIAQHDKKIEDQQKALSIFAVVLQKLTDIKQIHENAGPSTLLLHSLKYFAETTQKIRREYDLIQIENTFIPYSQFRSLATPEFLQVPESKPIILLKTIGYLEKNIRDRIDFGYDRIKTDSSALHYFEIVYNISAGEPRMHSKLKKLSKLVKSSMIRDSLRHLTAYNITMLNELVEYFFAKWVYRSEELAVASFVGDIKYVSNIVVKDVLFAAIPMASGTIGQWTRKEKLIMPEGAFIQCIPALKKSGHYYEHTNGKINGVSFYMNIGPIVGASRNKTIIAVRQYGLDNLQLEITFDIKDLSRLNFKGNVVPIPIHCSQGREWEATITSYTVDAIKPMVTIHVKGGTLPSNTLDFKEDIQQTIGEFSFTFAIDHWRIWREKLRGGKIPVPSYETQLERVILWKVASGEVATGKGPRKDNIPPDYGDKKMKRHIQTAMFKTSRSEMDNVHIVHRSQYDAIMHMPL